MMNKPFKGIKVPLKEPDKTQYRNGGQPQSGDLVTKRVYDVHDNEGNPSYRLVYGVVVDDGGPENFPQFPMIQWSEDYDVPVCCNPIRLKLVSRGE